MRIKITLPQGYENDKGDKGQYGEVVDFLPDLAVKLIRLNMAVPAPEPVIETAEAAPPENAAKRIGKVDAKRKTKGGPRKGSFSPEKE